MGETYDARLANPWDQPGFNDGKWAPVDVGAEMDPLMQAHPGPPVRAFATLDAQGITEPKPGVYVFDMGRNFAGVARLKFRGTRGQNITLRFAERLNPGRHALHGQFARRESDGHLHLPRRRHGNVGAAVHLSRLPIC